MHWSDTDIKAELLSKAEPFWSSALKYRVDEITANAEHSVLRLASYHCDLNLIELAWIKLKNNVASHNVL